MSERLLSINNYYYRRGGADVAFLEQNRVFEDLGWDVVPFAMRHTKNLSTPWDRFFIEEIEFGHSYGTAKKLKLASRVIYSLEARAKLAALLDTARPDIAHVHNIYHHLSPSILPMLKKAGIPVVMTVHDLKLACPAYKMLAQDRICERCRGGRIHNVVLNRCIKGSLPLSALVFAETLVHRSLRLYARNVDRFVVPSRFYIDKLVEWGWARDSFVQIPNFIDADRFEPQSSVGEGFVYFGRLSPEKGLETLIRAAAKARQRLTIVGTGPLESRLRELARSLDADVRFLGFQVGPALHAAIGAARAVVIPSIAYENAPISLLEAYALGRPVIGSRIGGLPEMIREDETGVTVAPGEAEDLASELSRFAELPNQRLAAMGKAARAWVSEEFSSAAHVGKLLSLYGSLRGRS